MDLVTTYNLEFKTLIIIPLNGLKGVTPIISRVISPVMSNY